MKTLKELQKEIVDNKRKHGFNTTDIPMEFCYLYGEVAEAYDAYYKQKDSLPEELADATSSRHQTQPCALWGQQ